MKFWADCFKRFFLFFCLCAACAGVAFASEKVSVCFAEKCFYPETARSPEEKQKGLMGRADLSESGGMLFIYDRDARPTFWMRNMLIPLDFLWIDEEGKVVDLHQNIMPCEKEKCLSLVSGAPVRYVLEVAAGTIKHQDIKVGDQAIIKQGATV